MNQLPLISVTSPAGIDWFRLGCTAAMALPFLVSAIAKAADFKGAIAEVAGLTGMAALSPGLAVLTIALQVLGSLCLFGPPPVRVAGVVLLAGFTMVATVLAHDFWNVAGPLRARQLVTFCEHLALIAGLLMLASGRLDR